MRSGVAREALYGWLGERMNPPASKTGKRWKAFREFESHTIRHSTMESWQSWLIAPVLKTGKPKGFVGSNPSLSANCRLTIERKSSSLIIAG